MPSTGEDTITIHLTLTRAEADDLPYHLIKAASAWAKEAEGHAGQTEIRDGQTLSDHLYEMHDCADMILRKVNEAIRDSR
mgnify:CR=1 FL=1